MNDITRTSKDLLPCPFCGGTVDPKGWMGTDSRGNRIQGPECEGCGATAPSLEVWNKRHALEPRTYADTAGTYAESDHEPPAEPDQPAVIQLVAVKNGRACVIGIPAHYSKLPEDHPWQHNCDANGCTSVEHMLWRGSVQDESTAQPPLSDSTGGAMPLGGADSHCRGSFTAGTGGTGSAQRPISNDRRAELIRGWTHQLAMAECEGRLDDAADGEFLNTLRDTVEALRGPQPQSDARHCPGCDLSLVECYDAQRKGCIKCCPDCDHRAHPTKPAARPPFGECTAVVDDGADLCHEQAEPGTHRCKRHSLGEEVR